MNLNSVSTLDDISFVSAEENVADLRDFDEISEILDLGTAFYSTFFRVAPDTKLAGYPAIFLAGYPAE